MRGQWELPEEDDLIYTGPDWLLLILDRYGEQTRVNFLMLIWHCWSVRNGVLMAGERISIEGSLIFLSRYITSLLQIRQQVPASDDRSKQKQLHKRWTPPADSKLKINVDGASIVETGEAAAGIAIRDQEGKPLLMSCRRLAHCRDAEEAEALACLEGVKMGARCNVSVIEKLKVEGVDRSVVAPILLDTLHEKAHLRSLVFVKIGREQNKVAHELAHLGVRSGVCQVWFASFPESLVTLACKDII
ncbi:hypothetical protein HU200_057134 [Digitaria exilis]|uniref:RNase H type-1 domain-containing protein n=1 Tax=Digitaria exilis TaxID=1010633 RepID=A0A835AFS4_9POAL|nr:hypothetical protein HU200_057134 [Digitaria exilis]